MEQSAWNNAIIIAPVAAAKIGPDDIKRPADLMARAKEFITQMEQLLEAALRACKSYGLRGETELNPAPAAELSQDMLALYDFVTPSETKCEALSGIAVKNTSGAQTACDELVAMSVGRPIITMGEQGAFLSEFGLVASVNAGPVMETTGAGDTFTVLSARHCLKARLLNKPCNMVARSLVSRSRDPAP